MDFNNSDKISINGLEFDKFIDSGKLQNRVLQLAKAIDNHYLDEKPIFVILLNGAFIFAADLLRYYNSTVETFFLKITSYHDLSSSGNVTFDKHKLDELKGRKILLIEDIIDTGTTMHHLLDHLKSIGVDDVEICSLLVKPGKLLYDVNVKFFGYEISDEFVVGYGLDYNENGRNLKHIYQLSIKE